MKVKKNIQIKSTRNYVWKRGFSVKNYYFLYVLDRFDTLISKIIFFKKISF